MSRIARLRARRRDKGMTLVELAISISIMGLICTVIAAVITTAFKNNPLNEIRTDTAHTLKGLVTWLPQDVDSTPPTGFDMGAATVSGCTSSPGTNLLRMEWTEATGGVTTHYVANYRWVAGTTSIIVRVTCSGTTAPYGGTAVLQATSALATMPGGWTPGNLPAAVAITTTVDGDVSLVTFDVATASGNVMHVDSAPKNPAHTLAPTTIEGASPPATTVVLTTTTTTAPSGTTTTVLGATTTTSSSTTTTTAPPCGFVSSTQSAAQLKNTDPNGNGNAAVNVGVLQQALTVKITTSGYCSGMVARAATGAPNAELFHNFSPTGANTWTVTFPGYPQGSSELWKDGARTITFYAPGAIAIGTTQITVK